MNFTNKNCLLTPRSHSTLKYDICHETGSMYYLSSFCFAAKISVNMSGYMSKFIQPFIKHEPCKNLYMSVLKQKFERIILKF